MRIRRSTVEHPYSTVKAWMGATHFLTKGLERVKAEMSLHVLAYDFRRLLAILGPERMLAAIRPKSRRMLKFERRYCSRRRLRFFALLAAITLF